VAEVTFAGLAPGLVGVMQLNLKIPAIAPGEQILDVVIGGISANASTLSIASRQVVSTERATGEPERGSAWLHNARAGVTGFEDRQPESFMRLLLW